ncbi:type VI secretion system tip protein TssI/VgrG, partial [Rhizobium sp. AAP43]|uniref:type VI secretion system tip protein TssI/VgrG n=1 Tax=Rhizobium sp. AAP43 TaxID=1523420 RepID=UPI0006CDF45E
KKPQVKPEELIGRLMDVSLEVSQGGGGGDGEEDQPIRRPFNGLVTDLSEGPPITRGLRAYSMVLRPQMWLLSRRSDCRIWMDKTALQVLDTLFSEHGIPAAETAGVITPPPAQHYSVQWNETDLAYLLRRFEEDGLFFWFSHENGRHKLHVADSASGWLKPSASAEGESRVRLAQGSTDRNHITAWEKRFTYVPGKRSGADWNFETPSMVPGTETPSLIQMPDAIKRELYEYPARIASVADAERAEKLRVQASEADHDRVHGASSVRVLEAGRRFLPYEVAHPDHRYDEHVIVAIRHDVVDRSYETAEDRPDYVNTFEAIPSRVPLTPHRETKRPKIEGTQVAIVAGPQGEEIHPDQYGRIKVWFPWDRKAKKDGTDTCWVRVAQNWAGAGWGGQVIPRIGMEVMVAYIDGDPDRPLVTGVVPNPQQKVPYTLPANKTKSTFRTQTHKGIGFNELSFEDQNGWEEIFVHAQKDRNEKTRNNQSERIDNNWVQSIGNSAAVEVERNHSQVIGGNMFLSVGPGGAGTLVPRRLARAATGVGDVAALLGGKTTSGGGSAFLTIEKNKVENVGAVSSINAGVGIYSSAGSSYEVSAGNTISLSAGQKFTESSGKLRLIQSGEEITLACGSARLTMKSSGEITLVGVRILLEGDEAITAKAAKINLN